MSVMVGRIVIRFMLLFVVSQENVGNIRENADAHSGLTFPIHSSLGHFYWLSGKMKLDID